MLDSDDGLEKHIENRALPAIFRAVSCKLSEIVGAPGRHGKLLRLFSFGGQ
jgi:hypothetical protein